MAFPRIAGIPKYRRKYLVIISAIMLLVTLLYFVPLWYAINNAFKLTNAIYKQPLLITPRTFTFSNITKAFRLLNYLGSFSSSLSVLAITLSITVISGAMAAYALVKVKNKIFRGIQQFIVILITLPIQLAMVPLIKVLDSFHLVGTYSGLSLILTAVGLPLAIFLYCNGVKSIPYELDEAATIDGCGFVKSFLYLYIPLLKNITGTVLILRGVAVWNDFMLTMITVSKPNKMTLPLMLFSTINPKSTDWGLLFAGTLLVSLPIIIAFVFLQKAFMKGFVSGSLKG